jgi:hypothetical protein
MPAASLVLAARSCAVVCFGFTVAAVLDSVQWKRTPRDLDLVEFWAGVGSVAAAGLDRGLKAETFEKNSSNQQNFFSLEGFMTAVTMIMRLRPGGLLGMAPTCSSFVFANVANTKRSQENGFAGDPGYSKAAAGNFEAQLAFFFMCLSVARGVHAFLENPSGSYMFKYLQKHLQILPNLITAVTYRCAFSTEELGKRIKKGYKFLATGQWIQLARRTCPCGAAGHVACMDTNEKGQVTGNQAVLQQSQAYPAALGHALVDAWLKAASWELPEGIPGKPAVPGVPGAMTGHYLQRSWGGVPASLYAIADAAREKEAKAADKASRKVDQGPWAGVSEVPGALTPKKAKAAKASSQIKSKRAPEQVDQGPWASALQPTVVKASKQPLRSSTCASSNNLSLGGGDPGPWG